MKTITTEMIRMKDVVSGMRISIGIGENIWPFAVESVEVTKKGKIHINHASYPPEQKVYIVKEDNTVTVGEVVALLLKEDQNKRFVLPGHPDSNSYDDFRGVHKVKLEINANPNGGSWGWGRHESSNTKFDEEAISIY